MAKKVSTKCMDFKFDYVTIEIILIIIVILVAISLIYKQNRNMNQRRLERFSGHLPSITMYYTNWCGHSRRMLPVFNSKQAEYLGIVDFVKYDCDSSEGRPKCSENSIKYLPTILFRKTPTSTPVKYSGGPIDDALKNFLETQLAA